MVKQNVLKMANKALASTNPFRHLPNNPAVLAVYRDVLCITKTLDTYLGGPAPITAEKISDRLEASSKMIRSLETRRDITWMVMAELRPGSHFNAILNDRPGKRDASNDMIELFRERLEALDNHWDKLEKNAPKPWKPEYDTGVLPPLLVAGEDEKSLELADFGISSAQSEKEFTTFKTEHSRTASYFIRHPPIARAFRVKEGVDGEEAYAKITDESGQVLRSKMVSSPDFEPVFFESRQMMTLDIPFTWEDPDAPGLTSEGKERIETENKQRYEEKAKSMGWDQEQVYEKDNCVMM